MHTEKERAWERAGSEGRRVDAGRGRAECFGTRCVARSFDLSTFHWNVRFCYPKYRSPTRVAYLLQTNRYPVVSSRCRAFCYFCASGVQANPCSSLTSSRYRHGMDHDYSWTGGGAQRPSTRSTGQDVRAGKTNRRYEQMEDTYVCTYIGGSPRWRIFRWLFRNLWNNSAELRALVLIPLILLVKTCHREFEFSLIFRQRSSDAMRKYAATIIRRIRLHYFFLSPFDPKKLERVYASQCAKCSRIVKAARRRDPWWRDPWWREVNSTESIHSAMITHHLISGEGFPYRALQVSVAISPTRAVTLLPGKIRRSAYSICGRWGLTETRKLAGVNLANRGGSIYLKGRHDPLKSCRNVRCSRVCRDNRSLSSVLVSAWLFFFDPWIAVFPLWVLEKLSYDNYWKLFYY